MEGIKSKILEAEARGELDQLFKYASGDLYVAILENHIEKLSDESLNRLCGLAWEHVTSHGPHSSEFVRKYSDKLNWNHISFFWDLSVEFIRQFADKLNWEYVSERHVLSDAFVLEFADRIHLEGLWANIHLENLSLEVVEQIGLIPNSRCRG